MPLRQSPGDVPEDAADNVADTTGAPDEATGDDSTEEGSAVGRADAIRMRGLVEVVRHVHTHPQITRAELARDLGITRGSAAEISSRLRAISVIDESTAVPTGGRGRPTRMMGPHPQGPLVCAVDISHERWRLAIGEVGGGLTLLRDEPHHRRADPTDVLARIAAAVREEAALRDGAVVREEAPSREEGEERAEGKEGEEGKEGTERKKREEAARRRERAEGERAVVRDGTDSRIRALGVSIAGTVSKGQLMVASNLGWENVDIAGSLGLGPAIPVVVGNDAILSGVAEARRGAARMSSMALHLDIEVGVGGVLLDQGRPVLGSTGAFGEFGHLPFGDPDRPCPCGAWGCWDTEVDGRALARHLAEPPPDDPRTAADAVLARAAAGDQRAQAAVDRVARDFGRGLGGLVNALDPEVVTLSGLAAAIRTISGDSLTNAYRRSLMGFRRAGPPPLLTADFPFDGSLRGAAELAFDEVLSEPGLHSWRTRQERNHHERTRQERNRQVRNSQPRNSRSRNR
jgi:predicted NBD/HSP70 family sugar kinase